jgi:uncharacterized protein YdeI (YjbR/CyaY-like superfamily)
VKVPDNPLYAADARRWRSWLEKNHASEPEVWLVFYKKHSRTPCVTFEQATEEALCFGWVDSAMRRLDDDRYVLRYTPRRKKSKWSEANRRLAEALIARGRMTAAGTAAIEEARKNGNWEAAR